MTNNEHQAFQPQAQTFAYQPNYVLEPAKSRNIPGLIALILAILGTVLACIAVTMPVGWLMLFAAFVLAVVALTRKNSGKGTGVAALITSVVGSAIGLVAFFAFALGELDSGKPEAKGPDPAPPAETSPDSSTPEQPDDGSGADTSDSTKPAETSDQGTRANPFPIGTTVTSGDWELTVNSVELDATQAIVDANMFNDAPADGHQYLKVHYSLTYIGDAADGEATVESVKYVTADGRTLDPSWVAFDDEIEPLVTLYEGGTISGARAFEVPSDSAGDGVLAIQAEFFADKFYVAVQ